MPSWTLGKKKEENRRIKPGLSGSSSEIVASSSNQLLEHAAERSIFKSDPTEGKYGLRVLHDPESAVADIIFVHGLTGNRENTWTRNAGKKNACFWPQDLLPDAKTGIANARIATWGYDADVVQKRPFAVVSNNTIEQHAANLCTDLANMRSDGTKDRQLIFVVHSLGGLVIKTALLHANERRMQSTAHIAAVADSTTGIVFIGTPHEGSAQAQWGGILASMLGYVKQDNAELVKRLNKEEPRLALLQERFKSFLETRKEAKRAIGIACFYEELPVPILGTIVPAASAQIDPYPAASIHANHMDMTRFGDDDSAGYVKMLNELRRLVQASKTGDQDPRATQSQFAPERDVGDTNFYGAISGNKVIAGMRNSGTTNITFD